MAKAMASGDECYTLLEVTEGRNGMTAGVWGVYKTEAEAQEAYAALKSVYGDDRLFHIYDGPFPEWMRLSFPIA